MPAHATLSATDAEAFLFREARLLDTWNLRAWQELLADDMVHWVPVNDEASDPRNHLSIVYDDRKRVDSRIWRMLESGLNHTQEPRSVTLRFISNVESEDGPDPARSSYAVICCSMSFARVRSGGVSRLISIPHAASIVFVQAKPAGKLPARKSRSSYWMRACRR